MIVLLIGPSGVGKSSCGEYASQNLSSCEFHDLDDLVAKATGSTACLVLREQGNDGFIEICQRILSKIETEPRNKVKLSLVAVGAGALQSHRANEWLKRYTTVLVSAPEAEVFNRNPLGRERNYLEFCRTEYSSRRQSIYNAATHKIFVGGLTKNDAQSEVLKYLRDEILHQDSKGND